MNIANQKTWHIDRWPLLAWIETVIKLVAFIFSFYAILSTIPTLSLVSPSGKNIALIIIQGVLSLGLVAAIFDRLQEKEIVAMLFVIFNNLAHWSAFILLFDNQPPFYLISIFWAAMLLGDLVKIVFLYVHNFTVRDTPKIAMVGLTGFYVLGYSLLLVLTNIF